MAKKKTTKEKVAHVDIGTPEFDTSSLVGKTVSFDAHEITDKIIQFGVALTGLSLYKYQYDIAYSIIYSVITFSGDVKTVLLSRQSGKCFSPDTLVRMADMSLKKAKDIKVGDYVMGINGSPRKVLETHRGMDIMYEITQRTNYGKSYVVNSEHILCFKERLKQGGYKDRQLSVKDYLKEPKWKQKDAFVGYRSPVDFQRRPTHIDPYFLGIWLGDGRSDSQPICTPDKEIVDYLEVYANRVGYSLVKYEYEDDACPSYNISSYNGHNKILTALRNYDLLDNKHIPAEYLKNSREVRLKLLAGLIDSDGHAATAHGKESVCEVTFCNEQLAKDVQTLALSLGFRCSLNPKKAAIKSRGYECMAYRLCLYGALWEIPTKVKRKQYKERELRENPLHYGFDVVPKGIGEYVGFEVDGDHLFLLDDFTVVHNSETAAFVIDTLLVLLPALAKIIPEFDQWKDGFRIGLFAPQSVQVDNTYKRAFMRLKSSTAAEVMKDPDIDIDFTSLARLELSNGSYLIGQVASKNSRIEGYTLDVVFIDEIQVADDQLVWKSIEPMTSATLGTIVKIGTTGTFKNNFYYEIQTNRNADRKIPDKRIRKHLEYDYKAIIADRREQFKKDGKRFHLNYEEDIKKKAERWGIDSQAFKLSYALIWDLESGMLVTDKEFNNILNRKKGWSMPSSGDFVVAGLDIARNNASTVLCIAKVFFGEDTYEKPYKEVLGFIEMQNMGHEEQHHAIMDAIVEYNISVLVGDGTGRGGPVMERLQYDCGEYVNIISFVFTKQSKSDMWFNFISDIQTKRLIVPANRWVRETREFQQFEEQMKNCTKQMNGAYLVCEKSEGFRDDFVDAIAMMCMAGNEDGEPEHDIEVDVNPLYEGMIDTLNKIRRGGY